VVPSRARSSSSLSREVLGQCFRCLEMHKNPKLEHTFNTGKIKSCCKLLCSSCVPASIFNGDKGYCGHKRAITPHVVACPPNVSCSTLSMPAARFTSKLFSYAAAVLFYIRHIARSMQQQQKRCQAVKGTMPPVFRSKTCLYDRSAMSLSSNVNINKAARVCPDRMSCHENAIQRSVSKASDHAVLM
jgi:hypothetical protein